MGSGARHQWAPEMYVVGLPDRPSRHPLTMPLQSRGLKLNPITTLYYVAPCCFFFLLFPFIFLEAVRF